MGTANTREKKKEMRLEKVVAQSMDLHALFSTDEAKLMGQEVIDGFDRGRQHH